MHLEEDRLVGHLAAMPDGAPAPVLCGLLGVSQPTLSRLLRRLQARGLVLAEGQARSRRYHLIGGRSGLAALRRRRLHEIVAHKLVDQPELLDQARDRLAEMSESNAAGRLYHEQWLDLMQGPRDRLLRKMTEDSEEADLLRKESPFTALIDTNERRELFQRLGHVR
jgi:DNA-binding transcriptional ArsR family regulator